MRVFVYTLPIDDGAAPNPFGGVCTLALCKPTIRLEAKSGDWVVGLDEHKKVVYMMKVTTKLTMREYDEYCKKSLPIKIPNISSRKIEELMGDCVYDFSFENVKLREGVHSRCSKRVDFLGEYVLLSEYFYYFGENPIDLGVNLKELNGFIIEHKEFLEWVESFSYEKNTPLSYPHRRGIIKPTDRVNLKSCCIRLKVAKDDLRAAKLLEE